MQIKTISTDSKKGSGHASDLIGHNFSKTQHFFAQPSHCPTQGIFCQVLSDLLSPWQRRQQRSKSKERLRINSQRLGCTPQTCNASHGLHHLKNSSNILNIVDSILEKQYVVCNMLGLEHVLKYNSFEKIISLKTIGPEFFPNAKTIAWNSCPFFSHRVDNMNTATCSPQLSHSSSTPPRCFEEYRK